MIGYSLYGFFGLTSFLRVVQSDNTITKARTATNDNSGIVGSDVSAADVVKDTVGVMVRKGEKLEENIGVGDEFWEAKFANVLNASFGFPLLSKRPKLESSLFV